MDIQNAGYAGREINIFLEILNGGVLIMLTIAGIWDLIKKEIPILLLTGLSVAACYIWWEASVWQQVWKAGIAVLLGLSGIWLVYGKRIGSGDGWMLICLAIIWPQEVFLQSLCHAAMLLCTIATVIWIMTGNEQIQIPMVPFLVLGYWL